jgi:type II secretory pathway pseudopilin PulG
MMELMVAIGVLLVAVVSAFSSQLTSMNLVSTSRETDTAVTDLQACMESILTLQTDTIPLASSPYADGVQIAGYDTLADERMIATYPGFPTGSDDKSDVPDPLEIVLTLTWDDFQGRPRFVTLTSVKTQ